MTHAEPTGLPMANWQMFVTTGPNFCTLTLTACLHLGHGICLQSSWLGRWLNLLIEYLPSDAGFDFKMVNIRRLISKRPRLDTDNKVSLSLCDITEHLCG